MTYVLVFFLGCFTASVVLCWWFFIHYDFDEDRTMDDEREEG